MRGARHITLLAALLTGPALAGTQPVPVTPELRAEVNRRALAMTGRPCESVGGVAQVTAERTPGDPGEAAFSQAIRALVDVNETLAAAQGAGFTLFTDFVREAYAVSDGAFTLTERRADGVYEFGCRLRAAPPAQPL